MKKIVVSAPGKLMLFGEHAVVYNRPCLVGAVNQRLFVEAEKISEKKIFISAPDLKISDFSVSLNDLNKEQPKEVKFVLETVKNFFQKYNIESGLKIKTESQISSEYGFGSSSAVTVCSIKALSGLFQIEMKEKEIFDLAYKTVLALQDVGSGFDIGAAIYGGVIYFLTGGKIIEPLKVKDIPLIVGYTGFKTSTSEIVKQVKAEMEKNPEYYENLYNQIAQIIEKAKAAMENSNWPEIGKLMSENQEILRKFKTPSKEYGVSSEIIEKLIDACQKAGAFGAKLSGAGVGDCIIALGEDKEKIEKAISQAGGRPVSVKIDYQGLKIEKIW
ncbi:MAG: mevalonate kinase [Patescibacteria group bacterium]|nr:mevalonate kinase [Patescibacteria group bacterium]